MVSQDQQQSSLSATSEELKTMLDVIQKEILPATEKGVSNGNKVFGAAILNADLQCEIASTNAETDCPIFKLSALLTGPTRLHQPNAALGL